MKGIFFDSEISNNTVEDIYGKFIARKKAMNLAEESIKYYDSCLKYFTDFYGKDCSISKVTKDTYFEYMGYLNSKTPPINSVTVNTYLRGTRAILYFAMQEGFIPQFKVSLAKQEKKIKETYTDSELVLLLEKPKLKTCTFIEYRNWAIINYLLATRQQIIKYN